MLHSKDITKISELKNDFTHRWFEPDFILGSLKCFSFSALCKCLEPLKQRGYSFESIFSCLICLPFLGLQTVHSFTGSVLARHIEARKDVLNRCILGYKLLVMGYRDGLSFIPLDFSLHRERGKNADKPFGLGKKEYRNQYRKKRKQVVHLIGMYKTPTTSFNYLGQMLAYSQIRNKAGKIKRCRKLRLLIQLLR